MKRTIQLLSFVTFVCGCTPEEEGNVAAKPVPEDPFAAAICQRDVRLVTTLVADGANPNALFQGGSANGFTPLTWALVFAPELCKGIGPNTEVAKTLIMLGADVNKPAATYGDRTPLMEAAANQNLGLVVYLLEQGADPNLLDIDGNTAAMFLLNRSPEILKALIEAGADLSIVSSKGITALSVARQSNLPEHVVLIETALAGGDGQ